MDYGKEAYSLVTELERRLSGGALSLTSAATVSDVECPPDKTTAIAEYTGGAAIVTVTVTSTGEGNIVVALGGAEQGVASAGGTHTLAFAASENGRVTLTPDSGVTVVAASVSAVGTNCAFLSSRTGFAADTGGTQIYAAACDDGLRVQRLIGGAFTQVAVLAEATDFDLAGTERGVLVASTDGSRGTLALIESGVITRSAEIEGCRRIAAARVSGGFAVAAFDGKRVTVRMYDDGLTECESSRAHGSPAVDRLAFVKGGALPALALGDGGKVLVRPPRSQSRCAVRLTVSRAAEDI